MAKLKNLKSNFLSISLSICIKQNSSMLIAVYDNKALRDIHSADKLGITTYMIPAIVRNIRLTV